MFIIISTHYTLKAISNKMNPSIKNSSIIKEIYMPTITYKHFEQGSIDNLKALCNGLMAFQAEHAVIRPDVMASMNFDNRLVPDYENADRKFMVVAYDGETPVGFAFATVSTISEAHISAKPPWAESIDGIGFYPTDYPVPNTIGTFKLLFVNPDYRGLSIGITLSAFIMDWLKSHEDVHALWVFVANGNEQVAKLYEKLGFVHSHSVFGGFIEAYQQALK